MALPLRVIVAEADEELVGRKPSPPGGARTVMLICRDDFKICIHFYMRKMAMEDARENYPTTTERRTTRTERQNEGRVSEGDVVNGSEGKSLAIGLVRWCVKRGEVGHLHGLP